MGKMGKPISTTGCKRGNKILEQNTGTENMKFKWKNYIETGSRMLEEGPQVNIHPDGLKATLKKYQTQKPLANIA